MGPGVMREVSLVTHHASLCNPHKKNLILLCICLWRICRYTGYTYGRTYTACKKKIMNLFVLSLVLIIVLIIRNKEQLLLGRG